MIFYLNTLKKFIVFCLALIAVMINPASAKQIGIEKAKQVSANWIFEKSRARYDIAKIKAAFIERSQSNNIYYVMNFPSGGWAILSADDVARPVIAYSSQGVFSPHEALPPQFQAWMDNIKNEIQNAIRQKSTPIKEATQEWGRLSVTSEMFDAPMIEYAVAPLLSTTWNQSDFYNSECPEDPEGPGGHVYAGCVATAMAQLMKYHNWPDTGSGSHSFIPETYPKYGLQYADFENTTYDWNSMPDSLDGASSSIEINSVANLIFHCAVSVEMDFSPFTSGANVSNDTTNALKLYFKYHPSLYYDEKANYSTTEWLSLMKTELNNGSPVLYRGAGDGGHAFICDGFGDPTDNYFHFNWGWGGYLDGYFLLDDLTPGSHSFNNDQGGIFNVQIPDELSYPYVEDFETELPEEWAFEGNRVSLDTTHFHSGAQSLLLSTEDGVGSDINNATLLINVPSQGATLSFWVKRGYNPEASEYNQQIAQLLDWSEATVLYTFYNGDFNDSQWQEFAIDLSPWADSHVKLFISQQNRSNSFKQWTYLDEVSITTTTAPCSFSISPTTKSFSSRGGTQTVIVDALRSDCSWTTSENLSWISISPTNGTGDGSVTVTVSANSGAERSGTVTIAGETFSVSQKDDSFTFYEVLTLESNELTVYFGEYIKVFGSGSGDTVNIESGGRADCSNFSGANVINIEEDSTGFTVHRSGATVYFENATTGTSIKLPATNTSQTISFTDGSCSLAIESDQVMLSDQVVSTAFSTIESVVPVFSE